jgi:Kdo2-lipid IVA lauroyltransferase/acyltransferase
MALISTLFQAASHLPLRVLHAAGGVLGWLTYWLSPSYRRRMHDNARLAGVPWAQARPAVAESGRMIAELPWVWSRPVDQPLGDKIRWTGAEHVEHALALGKGLLVLTPHIGSFEMVGQGYAERFGLGAHPMTALYRPARQPWMQQILSTSRLRPGLGVAPANLAGVRQMIRALRRGETLGLLPDQVPPETQGVWAPFFGKPAYTMTLAARLAQQTGATILLIRGERLPRGQGWCLHAEPLPEPLPPAEAGEVEAASVINRAMEHMIRQLPGQYLWGYHRYKHPRPAEVPATGAAS